MANTILPHPAYGHSRFIPPENVSQSSRKDLHGKVLQGSVEDGRWRHEMAQYGTRWYSPYSLKRQLLHSQSDTRSRSSESIEEEEEEKEDKRRRICNIIKVLGILAVVGVVACIVMAVLFSRKFQRTNANRIYTELKLDEQFQKEFYDSSSDTYRSFVGKLQTEMYTTFATVSTFEGFEVRSLRPGSVVVTGVFYFGGKQGDAINKLQLLTTNPSPGLKLAPGSKPTLLVIDSNITSIARDCNQKRGHYLTQEGTCQPCGLGFYSSSSDSENCIVCSACLPCPAGKTTQLQGSSTPFACLELSQFTIDMSYGQTFIEEYRVKNSSSYLDAVTGISDRLSQHLSTQSSSVTITAEVILLRRNVTDTLVTIRLTVTSSDRPVRTVVEEVNDKLNNFLINSKQTTVAVVGSSYYSSDGPACLPGHERRGAHCSPCRLGWYSNALNSCVQCPGGYSNDNIGSTECKERNECLANPCDNGGTCTDEINDFSCNCLAGYSGKRCETDIDECLSSPCANGSTCMDQVDGFICQCPSDIAGTLCDRAKTACDNTPCLNGATCTDDGTLSNFACACAAGFSGDTCDADIDECGSNPCQNGGQCSDEINGFTCDCATGWSGATCAMNIDDCVSNPCVHGTCSDLVNDYSCECEAGYSGRNCSIDSDECAGVTCFHGGTCEDKVNGFKCHCDTGYEGKLCIDDVDECASDSHGCEFACENFLGRYRCTCDTGYGLNDDSRTCRRLNKCERDFPCRISLFSTNYEYDGKCIPIGLDDHRCECQRCTCSSVQIADNCLPTGNLCPDPNNTQGEKYVSPHDCGEFITCQQGRVIAVPQKCPANQYFFKQDESCILQTDPNVANCNNDKVLS